MVMRYGLIALCLIVAACDQEAAAESGEGLYQENCGSCHNGGVYKAPHRMFLGMMAPDAILASMDGGIMAEQANALSAPQKRAVAEHIAGRSLDADVVDLGKDRGQNFGSLFEARDAQGQVVAGAECKMT